MLSLPFELLSYCATLPVKLTLWKFGSVQLSLNKCPAIRVEKMDGSRAESLQEDSNGSTSQSQPEEMG